MDEISPEDVRLHIQHKFNIADIEHLYDDGLRQTFKMRIKDGVTYDVKMRREPNLSKSQVEYATVCYVRQHTTIPVPEIVYSDGSVTVMGHIDGLKANDLWECWDMEHKLTFVRNLAQQIVKLYHCRARFDGFGQLQLQTMANGSSRIGLDRQVLLNERLLEDLEHKNRVNPCEAFQKTIDEVRHIFTQIPASQPYILSYGDLDLDNILATPDGQIKAILGWEDCWVVPQCFVYRYMVFLETHDFDEDHEERLELREELNNAIESMVGFARPEYYDRLYEIFLMESHKLSPHACKDEYEWFQSEDYNFILD